MPDEARYFFGQLNKDRLRDVFRQTGIAVRLAERRGIDEVNVPLHQLGERAFRAVLRVGLQQFSVGGHLSS